MRTGEDNWGPWATGIDPAERLARVRSLRSLAHARFGIEHFLVAALLRAESLRPEDLDTALSALNQLPTRDRRNVVSLYQSVASMTMAELARRAVRRAS